MNRRIVLRIIIGFIVILGVGIFVVLKSPIPTYPNIYTSLPDPDPQSNALAYFKTIDSRETIMEFYRTTMPTYGWVEQPAQLTQFMHFVQRTDSQSIMLVLIEDYGQFRTVKVGSRVRIVRPQSH